MKKTQPRLLRFGEVVQFLRERQGLSIAELAELADLPLIRLTALEYYDPDATALDFEPDAVAKLAAALDVDPRMIAVALPKEAP